MITAGIVAFVISTTLSPLGSRIFKSHLHPSSIFRQTHEQPISRLGGIGIVVGFSLTVSLLLLLRTGLVNLYFTGAGQVNFVYWLTGLGLSVFLLGLLDDLLDIQAKYKLLVQLVIALLTAYKIIPIDKILLPVWGGVDLGNWGILLAAFWIVGVMNAFNLIDGLDSLAGGVAMIALSGVLLLSLLHHDLLLGTLCFTLIASISGFLVFNIHPAKVFMGDGGSLFLGFMLATLPLIQLKQVTGVWSIMPVILIGIPIVDTLFSILRRFLRGVPIFSADKSHIHHKLIFKGLSHRQSVQVLHLASLGYLGIYLMTTLNLINTKLGFISFFALSWLVIFYAGYEEIAQPFKTIRNRKSTKKDRTFFMELSENINLFYKHATLEEVFFVLVVWAEQAQVKGIELTYGGKTMQKYFAEKQDKNNTRKILEFKKDKAEIKLLFDLSFFEIDSDVKFDTLNNAMERTLIKLNELV